MWHMFKVIRSNRPEIEIYGNLKQTSSDHQIIALLWEIRVSEYNSGVRILTGSSEITVTAHVQCKLGQKTDK